MIKRNPVLVFLFCVLAPSASFSQSLQFNLTSDELPSDISAWYNTPKVIPKISFAVPEGILVEHAHIVFDVTKLDTREVYVTTVNSFASQPSITGTFKTKSFAFNALVADTAIGIHPSIKADSGSIGKLPEGRFGICFYLVDSSGKPVSGIEPACSKFSVRDIDEPRLLDPNDSMVVSDLHHVSFRWTPARVTSQTVHYVLKLYPILAGQSAMRAMAGSSALYTSGDIFSETFGYPADAPNLFSVPNAIGFAWIVTQLDEQGKTIGKNYGRSKPSSFMINARTPEQK